MNDNEIIQQTRIEPGDGFVEMIIDMPEGEPFKQRAKDAESAKKHIMAWCESVRNEATAREERRKEEQEAAKKRRQSGLDTSPDPAPSLLIRGTPKDAIISWYDTVQEDIDDLSAKIEELRSERDMLRNQRDEFAPLVAKWKGVE